MPVSMSNHWISYRIVLWEQHERRILSFIDIALLSKLSFMWKHRIFAFIACPRLMMLIYCNMPISHSMNVDVCIHTCQFPETPGYQFNSFHLQLFKINCSAVFLVSSFMQYLVSTSLFRVSVRSMTLCTPTT